MNKKNLKDTIGKIGRIFRKDGIVFRHFVLLLAVIVVFTTTYSLVLPALTIDARTADATPGIEMEKDGEGSSGEEEVPDGEAEKADEDNQSSEPAEQSRSSQESKSSSKSKKSKKQPVVEDFFEAETVPAIETETEKHIKVEEAVSEKEPEEKMTELADKSADPEIADTSEEGSAMEEELTAGGNSDNTDEDAAKNHEEEIDPAEEKADSNLKEDKEDIQKEEEIEEDQENEEGEAFEASASPVKLARMLTDGTGLWVKNSDGDWELITEDTVLSSEETLIVRLAYEIPQGTLSEKNAKVSYKLPKKLPVNKASARMANDPDNHLNQVIEGVRLPGEKLADDEEEYLAGNYKLDKTLTGRYQLKITFNDYSIAENADSDICGWLMFYIKDASLSADKKGKGSITFSEESANGKELKTEYTILSDGEADSDAQDEMAEDFETEPVTDTEIKTEAAEMDETAEAVESVSDSEMESIEEEEIEDTEADYEAESDSETEIAEETAAESEEESEADTETESETESESEAEASSEPGDFSWNVDGKEYEYKIEGGTGISLRDMFTELGVCFDDPETEEDEVRLFLDSIEDVGFSNPDLAWVGKVQYDNTISSIKEFYEFDCEYAAGLTKDDIARLDSREVYAGEWGFVSLAPFTNEESLTVTMDNGEAFVIKMKDAPISKTMLSASGDSYDIIVNYDEDAEIPNDAELKVREILPGDDDYAEYYDSAVKAAKGEADEDSIGKTITNSIADLSRKITRKVNKDTGIEDYKDCADYGDNYARFFDIEIWSGDQKIEPKAEVSVNIQLHDAPADTNANPNVVHFAEEGPEVMDIAEPEDRSKDEDTESKAEDISFLTNGFSVYGIVYTVDFHWEVDGKVYEISIPGGGFLSFEKLVEILEIAKTDKEAESGNNQRAKSESDAAEETENSDEMAENNEASESTEDIEPDKETENTDKTVSASDDSQINEISDELSKKDIFLLALKDVRVSEETKEFVAKVDHIEFSNPELLWVDKVEKECTVSELKENNNLEVQYSDELTEEQIDEINAQTVETGDWALISLQQFYTEETLTVTMTNGKTWTIRVTDAVAENPVRNPGTVNTVDTYADGVKMWLFNYDTDGNLDDSSNKIKFNGTDHTGKVGFNNNTLASDGINGYSGLKFLGWGSDSDYNITSNVDINNFTGLDESGQGKGNKIKALQGIVQNSLDENGYPVLNSQYSSTSLDYLFDPTANTNDRVVYGGENGNVTNLFRKENGYYKFDSNQHYAQFDGDHTFTVYDTTIPQTDKNGNKHNPTRAVGFFPFNSYNNMLGIWDTNQNQNGSHTLYLNPDRDTSKTDRAGVKDLDHHFGVMLEAKFVLPADGKDENGNPIRFDFSGDDDMWVFIDDELVLDIGGIHQPVSGTIDFQNGKAYVVGDHTVAGHSDNTGTNAVATAYGAGVTRNSTGDGNYYFYNDDSVGKKIQLGDGKVHTMKIFYIERGGCDSNCEITFNLPTVKTGNLDLKKVWGDVERRAEEVYYTITANYKEASDANKRDLAKFFSSMTEKQLTQYGLTKDNIKQIDANNDGVLDTNDPYVFVVKGSDWELKIKQLRICQDSLQNGNLTHDQIPLTYTVLERYALVDGKIVDATDQYSQAVEKSGAQLPSTSDIILGENDVSLWQDITGNNATFKVTNEPGMNVTVNKDWAQDCDPLSDTTITGVVKRYKLVDKGNTLTIQSVLEDTDNSGIDFSGVTYTIMKNGQQVGDPISFAEAQAGKNLELPDSGPYTVVENNVPGTPQGYSVVHNPQNQQHNVTLDPNGNTTVTFTSTYKQVNKPSNSTYLIRDYYYYNYQGGKDLNSGNIEFPVGARVTMKFKCRNGYWSSRDMKAEYNGERINITASAKDNNQNLEFTVGPFTVVENGRLVVDVNTNGNSNNDGFVSGSVNFTQVRSLHSNLRAMRMPLKAAPQKTDLTFSQELNETTLASLPAAPEGKHYVLDNWSKEVNLDAASDWTKTVAVEVGNNYGDYYYFLASVTEHNVTQDTQGTIATNNDGSIRFAHKHADSNLPFEIENKRAKGALKITKNVTYNNGTIGDIPEGKESLVDKEFKFTVTKDGTQIEGSPFSITITNGASQILTIPDLEMGNYVITETDSKGLELTAYTGGISQDSTTKSVTVTVTARDNTAAQPTAQAFFTNNYSETDIIVKKVDQDKATANPEDAERFIAGAKFSLLDGDERAVTGYKVINLKTNQEVVLEDNKFVVPLEGVKITGLLNGSYVLKEQEAPAGYIITNNTTAFTVADGQVTAGGNGLTFEIPNPPGAALPNTGGPGTNKIYLLGIMLSGIAGAGLVMRKRRRAA